MRKDETYQDFPGDGVVKNLASNAGNVGSILGQGTKIQHGMGCSQKVSKQNSPLKFFLIKNKYEKKLSGE